MKTVLDRMREIMAEVGVSTRQLTEEFGISNSSFTDWKNAKGGYPPTTVLVKFVERFDVSLDYLVFGTDSNTSAGNPQRQGKEMDISNSEDEILLAKFHSLPIGKQLRLLGYIDGMLAAIQDTTEVE